MTAVNYFEFEHSEQFPELSRLYQGMTSRGTAERLLEMYGDGAILQLYGNLEKNKYLRVLVYPPNSGLKIWRGY